MVAIRELDLTYLNDERFAKIGKVMGRKLNINELQNCRKMNRRILDSVVLGPQGLRAVCLY
jgi:hypothetical protein